jgi:hypothetical protein
MYQILLYLPKSPDKLGDFDSNSPLFKGARGDQLVLNITAKYFSNILLPQVCKSTSSANVCGQEIQDCVFF